MEFRNLSGSHDCMAGSTAALGYAKLWTVFICFEAIFKIVFQQHIFE